MSEVWKGGVWLSQRTGSISPPSPDTNLLLINGVGDLLLINSMNEFLQVQ